MKSLPTLANLLRCERLRVRPGNGATEFCSPEAVQAEVNLLGIVMNGEEKSKRLQARQTIVSALRIIRNLQDSYNISTSEVLSALALMYREAACYDSAQWVGYAARQVREEEKRGGK